MFLSAEELSQLTGYKPSQRSRMCRWLQSQSIPYTINRLGDPVVLRTAVEKTDAANQEPKFDWLKKSA